MPMFSTETARTEVNVVVNMHWSTSIVNNIKLFDKADSEGHSVLIPKDT